MCGFAAIYKNKDLNEFDRQILEKMSVAIRHRGPDEDMIEIQGNMGFAFRRLSIIDLALGSQPYTYMDRYTAVYNGEIYNYRELKEPLKEKGYDFKTNSEIEVLLTLYHDEGAEFIKKLRGMFAFLIYDKETNKIMGGRDSFGIKPFYYRQTKESVTVCSEMKGYLFDPAFNGFNVNKSNLQHYFTYQYVPEPNTMSDDIKILEAGHYFECENPAEIKITKYKDNCFAPDNNPYDEKLKRVRDVIESSVKYHMISDVPVGTFLSSGVDSAIITALASSSFLVIPFE